jgi:hypothetical protein
MNESKLSSLRRGFLPPNDPLGARSLTIFERFAWEAVPGRAGARKAFFFVALGATILANWPKTWS